MIDLDTKAYYYEKLLRIMVTPPKRDDDIHGVYSPGTVKMTSVKEYPAVYLSWEILPGKMEYNLLVIPGYYHDLALGARLYFKKTPQTQAWVNRRRSSEIEDKGDHYVWRAKKSQYSDWFNDNRLQNKYREIPSDLLNMAALTIKEKFLYFCRDGYGGGNPYFDLYMMLE